ncbi:MAG: DUF1295 domain-containing protein [Candidatus Helarchaeota archaeon]|nr:DUF1295 domain-containing protein [Candidatus Helarchaeota archaeon]
MVIIAVIIFIMLFFVSAGYGQYITKKWGKSINNKAGWVIMEIPVVIIFLIYWIVSERTFEITPMVFFVLFNIHYCQRTFVFPLLIRGKDDMPWTIILFGMVFNSANAYMQGTWIFFLSPATMYPLSWLATPQFIIGVAIFLTGFVINIHSDYIIRNLRKPGDTAFYIPRGGMFRYVTSANYLGEFTEWVGWACMTLSWAGLVFAIWTFANLAPRANRHHRWYKEKFGDEYPKNRKRMIPFLY